MDLSIIIVNYNVRHFLENALASLKRASAGLSVEVFVVDNASDDGSVEMLRDKFPEVILIESKVNLGFARANNIALKQARGRHFLLINPDTIVQEDTLHVMLDFFKNNPTVGLAGCEILNPDGSFQLPCRRSFPTPWVAFTKIMGLSSLFPTSRLFGKYNLTYLSTDETYEVDAVSGSFMMISQETYSQVGGLDEAFFMYGEDLDWCYRVKQSSSKVFYVHATQIIHYKGESTRRSDIDEIRTFYHAMQLFVEKHFSRSPFVEVFLNIGILLRAMLAFAVRGSSVFVLAMVDLVLVDIALVLAELIYFNELFHFPDGSYPVVWTIPALIVTCSLYLSGAYTTSKYSVSRSGVAVLIGYILISALVFFAKDFAFSRAVVLISGVLTLVMVPGWRLVFRLRGGRTADGTRGSLLGRRTIVVGTGPSAQEVVKKLRGRVDGGYDLVGFVDTTRKRIGEKVAGLEIIGSIDHIGKVINERKVGEVIFSTDGLAYTDILSVIARSNTRGVNFRLVPNSLEAIIGKTRIDSLDALPLIDIEYNIRKPVHRVLKRLFDIVCTSVLLLTIYHITAIRHKMRPAMTGTLSRKILLLPQVFSGRLSLVGRLLPDGGVKEAPQAVGYDTLYLGKHGLTGIVQIHERQDLEPAEIEKFELYYAKNQSSMLDLEIVLKSILLLLKQ
ncbi:MAG: glycosyltransferase [Bacteroidota bacterium]